MKITKTEWLGAGMEEGDLYKITLEDGTEFNTHKEYKVGSNFEGKLNKWAEEKLIEIKRYKGHRGDDEFSIYNLVNELQDMVLNGYKLKTIRHNDDESANDGVFESFTFVFTKKNG